MKALCKAVQIHKMCHWKTQALRRSLLVRHVFVVSCGTATPSRDSLWILSEPFFIFFFQLPHIKKLQLCLISAVSVCKAFTPGHDKFRFSCSRVTLSVLTSLLVSRPSLKTQRSNTLSLRSCLSRGSVEANMNIKKKKNPAWKRNAEWQGHYHFKGFFFSFWFLNSGPAGCLWLHYSQKHCTVPARLVFRGNNV